MRRSSCSTTPISMRRPRARSSRSTAMRARRASARTASSCSEGVYDAFAGKLAEKVGALKVGRGTERGVTQGPLINADAVAKVEEHSPTRQPRGAKVVTGGKRHALGGTFYEPTVLTGVTPEMQIFREETFGPVAPLIPLQGRRRSGRAREPHRVRPRLVLLQPRHRPRSGASPKRSNTGWSASTPASSPPRSRRSAA